MRRALPVLASSLVIFGAFLALDVFLYSGYQDQIENRHLLHDFSGIVYGAQLAAKGQPVLLYDYQTLWGEGAHLLHGLFIRLFGPAGRGVKMAVAVGGASLGVLFFLGLRHVTGRWLVAAAVTFLTWGSLSGYAFACGPGYAAYYVFILDLGAVLLVLLHVTGRRRPVLVFLAGLVLGVAYGFKFELASVTMAALGIALVFDAARCGPDETDGRTIVGARGLYGVLSIAVVGVLLAYAIRYGLFLPALVPFTLVLFALGRQAGHREPIGRKLVGKLGLFAGGFLLSFGVWVGRLAALVGIRAALEHYLPFLRVGAMVSALRAHEVPFGLGEMMRRAVEQRSLHRAEVLLVAALATLFGTAWCISRRERAWRAVHGFLAVALAWVPLLLVVRTWPRSGLTAGVLPQVIVALAWLFAALCSLCWWEGPLRAWVGWVATAAEGLFLLSFLLAWHDPALAAAIFHPVVLAALAFPLVVFFGLCRRDLRGSTFGALLAIGALVASVFFLAVPARLTTPFYWSFFLVLLLGLCVWPWRTILLDPGLSCLLLYASGQLLVFLREPVCRGYELWAALPAVSLLVAYALSRRSQSAAWLRRSGIGFLAVVLLVYHAVHSTRWHLSHAPRFESASYAYSSTLNVHIASDAARGLNRMEQFFRDHLKEEETIFVFSSVRLPYLTAGRTECHRLPSFNYVSQEDDARVLRILIENRSRIRFVVLHDDDLAAFSGPMVEARFPQVARYVHSEFEPCERFWQFVVLRRRPEPARNGGTVPASPLPRGM